MLILVSGGSASGKSEFAESLVLQSGCDRRYYLATMIPYDEECRRRISRHRKMRAAKGFETIEVPVGLCGISFPSTLKEGTLRAAGVHVEPGRERNFFLRRRDAGRRAGGSGNSGRN